MMEFINLCNKCSVKCKICGDDPGYSHYDTMSDKFEGLCEIHAPVKEETH